MSQIIGNRTTYQADQESRIIRDVYPDIALLDPDKAPLVTLSMKLRGSKPCTNPKLEWYEDDYVARWAVNGTATVANSTSSTTVTVTDGTLFRPGDIFLVPKAVDSSTAPELCRVTAVSSNTLTVVRNIGGGSVDTIPANWDLRLVGSAAEENGAFPSPKATTKTQKISYTQIFRTPTDYANTAIATETYGAPSGDRKFEHRKKLVEHKEKLNAALLFYGAGQYSAAGGPNGNPIRTTQGLMGTITTNITDGGGVLTKKKIDSYARQSFRYGSSNKLLLAAPIIAGAINAWATSFLNVSPGETHYGVNIKRIETPYGNWSLVTDWMLENGAGGYGFAGQAFSIDLDQIFIRHLAGNGENRNTKIMLDVVKDGTDGTKDEILSEIGYVIRMEKYHSRLYNVTDYME